MNNLKKLGLTALAASLVATSAFSAEFGVSGSAGITVENNSQSAAGKAFSMPNSVYLSGSGETDAGLTVSASFELDQNSAAGSGPFDNHSVSVGSDSIGTVTLHGHGGSSAQSALDTTAAGDLWDNGFGINTSTHTPKSSDTDDNMLVYSLPSMVDGLAASVSYTPKNTGAESSSAIGLTYTGIDGLSVSWGYGDDNSTTGTDIDVTTVSASYAISSFTIGYSNTDYNSSAASKDMDIISYNVAYSVSDSISIGYGAETHELEGSATDIEVSGINAAYTAGGMTLSVAQIDADNIDHSTTAEKDRSYFKVAASFAF